MEAEAAAREHVAEEGLSLEDAGISGWLRGVCGAHIDGSESRRPFFLVEWTVVIGWWIRIERLGCTGAYWVVGFRGH